MKVNIRDLIILVFTIVISTYSIWGCFYYNTIIEGDGVIVEKYSYSADYRDFDGEQYFRVRLNHKGKSLYQNVLVTKSWWNNASLGDKCHISRVRWVYDVDQDGSISTFGIAMFHVLACLFTIVVGVGISGSLISKAWKFLDKDITI